MRRVLLTGATGFIGGHCIKALQSNGFDVHALSFQADIPNTSKVVWHRVDLHDHRAVTELLLTTRPSFLLHSAWYIEHGDHWSSQENLKWVTSSLHLAEEFINYGGEKLSCVGTCAEYDWGEISCSTSVSEDLTPLKPHTVYGASKAGLFMMLQALCKAKGMRFVWTRPFGPFGFHDNPKRLIPYAILSLLRGQIVTCNNPEFVRNFTFVEDIAQLLAELVSNETFGPINIANGQAVTLKYVVESIAKLLGAENLVQYRLDSIKTTEPPLLTADVTKLKSELGYIAPTSVEEGLEKALAWWQKELGLASKTIVSI